MNLRSSQKALISQMGAGYGFQALIVLILFFTSTSWIGDGVNAICENYQPYKDNKDILQTLFGFLLFSGLFFYGSRRLKNAMPDIDVETNESPIKSNGLVIFLSPPSNLDLSDINSLSDFERKRHNWEMPCIAIDYHKDKLTNLSVVLPDIQNKQKVQDDFKNLVENLFGSNFCISFSEPINFEDLEKVYGEISKQFDSLRAIGLKEREIVIDVTGGQKTVSIAGAIYTFGYERKFQYVSTNTKKVLSYNIRYDFEGANK